jgi:hypothetical protein
MKKIILEKPRLFSMGFVLYLQIYIVNHDEKGRKSSMQGSDV